MPHVRHKSRAVSGPGHGPTWPSMVNKWPIHGRAWCRTWPKTGKTTVKNFSNIGPTWSIIGKKLSQTGPDCQNWSKLFKHWSKIVEICSNLVKHWSTLAQTWSNMVNARSCSKTGQNLVENWSKHVFRKKQIAPRRPCGKKTHANEKTKNEKNKKWRMLSSVAKRRHVDCEQDD